MLSKVVWLGFWMLTGQIARAWRTSAALYAATGGDAVRVVRYNARLARSRLPLVAPLVREWFEGTVRDPAEWTDGAPHLRVNTLGGGLGDDIVSARFLRDLGNATSPFTFDVATSDAARSAWVFASVPGFQQCIARSPLTSRTNVLLDIDHVARVRHALPRSHPLSPALQRLTAFVDDHRDVVAHMPDKVAELARRAVMANQTRATFLHAQAEIAYGGDSLPLAIDERILARVDLTGASLVTVHNGFDPAFVISGTTATKCFARFDAVIAALRLRHPDVRFVQIGSTTSTPIAGVDLDLTGMTSLPEAAALIARARLHLDIDSGLVHAAAALGTRAVVVFGPTDADYFTYPSHVAMRARACGGCWWINGAWMDQCPRGFSQPLCMVSHDIDAIAAAAAALL